MVRRIPVALALSLAMVATIAAPAMADTIKDGTITDTVGNVIALGYDQFGYNYQAHIFNGYYSSVDRVLGGDFSDVKLQMKWNDAWLSNKDLTGDGKLDRHYGSDSYIGSGAWLTNHDSGINADGKRWTYFVKIVAAPDDATLELVGEAEYWFTADGDEIGPEIWGEFAVVQQVVTGDPPSEFIAYDGWPLPNSYRSPIGCGLGKY